MILVRNASSQLELRSAVDDSLLVVLESSDQAPAEAVTPNGLLMIVAPAQIALDGSWVWAATTAGLFAWRTSDGARLWTRAGDYSNAHVIAGAEGAYVAHGPAGERVIEFIRAAGDESSVSPEFAGEFVKWFEGTAKFFTRDGTTYRIVNADGSVAQTFELDGTVDLIGSGSTFAINQPILTQLGPLDQSLEGQQVSVFPVGETHPVVQANNDSWGTVGMGTFTLAVGNQPGVGFTIYDMHTSPPTRSATVSADYGWSINASTLTDDFEGNWAMMGRSGSPIRIGSTSLPSPVFELGCGRVISIEGSESGRFVVEVGENGGQLWVLESSASGFKLLGGLRGSGAQLSADGATLLHLESTDVDAEWVLHKLPTPSHPDLTRVVLPPDLLPTGRAVELAKNGTAAAVYASEGFMSADGLVVQHDCSTRVKDLGTGAERFSVPDTCPAVGANVSAPDAFQGISPDGWDIAFNLENGLGVFTSHAGEPLVPQGQWFLGWLGSQPIIGTQGMRPSPSFLYLLVLASASVAGRPLALSELVPIAPMRAAGDGLFFDPTSGAVRSNSDGSIVFQSSTPGKDTVVAGSRLVHWTPGRIWTETFR
ncbi:MAG: hypothetical protein QM778_34190 [Myxococcales bacterium]